MLVLRIVALTHTDLNPVTNEFVEVKLFCSDIQSYVEEPFWIDVLTINVTNDTIRIPYPAPEGEIMEFEGTFHNQSLSYEGISTLSLKTPIAEIPPGDTVYRVFNFWESFLLAEKWCKLPKTGTVTLIARFGGAQSNEISFTIEKPTCLNVDAYNQWRKYKDSYWIYPVPTNEERLDYLQQLVSNYPNTGYAEWALYELMRKIAKGHDNPQKQSYAKLLIEDYPSSGFVKQCLPVYLTPFAKAEKDSLLRSFQSPDKPLRMRLIVSNRLKGFKYP